MAMERDTGWYRDESGNLRYWNGKSWAGQSVVQRPVSAPARTVTPAPQWSLPVFALGWIAAIFTLGMVLTGVSSDGVDCGTVFGPRDSQASCAEAVDARTTAARLTGAAALLCFAASSRTATRIATSRCLRGTKAMA